MIERLSQLRGYRKQLHLLAGVLLGIFGLFSLAACSTEGNNKTLPATSVVATQTPTLTGPEKDATKNARFNEEQRLADAEATRFALGTPDPTLGPYVGPTRRAVPTLVTGGPVGDCADADRDFMYVGCWAERIGNDYLIIESGAFQEAGAVKPDYSQGMLRVYTMTWDLQGYSDVSRKQLYKTPSKSGRVLIIGVNWPLMTLIAVDSSPPVTFGFDLTTRQWMSPPPQPTVYAQMTRRAEWKARVQTKVALTGTIPIPTRKPRISPTPRPFHTPSAVVHTSTPLQLPVPPGQATHSADETRITQYREQRMTVVALTPPRPVPLTITPLPTPTWSYGLYHCSGGSKLEPELVDCWRGIVNGEVISVASGNESPFTDPIREQGVIVISHGPYIDPSSPSTEIYSTTLRLGSLRMARVNGTLFTLMPIDMKTPKAVLTPWATQTPGITFIFDLSARQWVNP